MAGHSGFEAPTVHAGHVDAAGRVRDHHRGGGGGASGVDSASSGTGGNGGSGIVVIRYPGTQRGTGGTANTSGGYTTHTFTSSGTYTA